MINKSFKLTALSLLIIQSLSPVHAQSQKEEQTITVDADRTKANVAKQAQKDAPNLVNVLTQEEIRQMPDVNIGEALRRLPGVSLETDTGEGRFVYIRGLDADLNGTTFDGLRLPPSNSASPNSGGGGRAVAFDAIPSGLVGSVTVTKTNIPEQDAEAIGGTIELTSKKLPLNGKPFFDARVGGGVEKLRNTSVLDLSFSAGTRFGSGNAGLKSGILDSYSDKPFSIIVTAVNYNDQRGINDVEPSPNGDGTLGGWSQRYYQYNRKRHGYGLDLGYQPDADNSYYFRAFDTGYEELKQDNILNINLAGAPISANGSYTDTASKITRTLADADEVIKNQLFSLGGKNKIKSDVIDYRIGYALGSDQFKKSISDNFLYTGTLPSVTYNNAGVGGTPLYTATNSSFINPSNYVMSSISSSPSQTKDVEYSGALNYKTPVKLISDNLGSDSEFWKSGINSRWRTRTSSSNITSFTPTTTIPLSNFTSGSNLSFYENQYNNGPAITPGIQNGYTLAATAANAQTSAIGAQNDQENVLAAYSQYEMKKNRLSLIAGLRYEGTHSAYSSNSPNANGDTGWFATSSNNHYGNLFPSMQTKYDLDEKSLIRLAYSTSIARPTFLQASPSVNFASAAAPWYVTTGNPNLKPTTAQSFDLSYEKYLDNSGILSVGIFDKELSNYIASRTLSQTAPVTGIPNSQIAAGDQVYNTTFSNISAASVYGLEFAYEQQYKQLQGLLGGLGTSFNYTYVKSNFDIRTGESSQLPGTSKNTYNASVFYKYSDLTLRASLYYASEALWNIGSSALGDTYVDNRTSIDLNASYKIDKNYGIYLSGKNLNNNPLTYLSGPGRSNIIQREYYGQTYLAGVNLSF
jgi:TonB-dependent receptor